MEEFDRCIIDDFHCPFDCAGVSGLTNDGSQMSWKVSDPEAYSGKVLLENDDLRKKIARTKARPKRKQTNNESKQSHDEEVLVGSLYPIWNQS